MASRDSSEFSDDLQPFRNDRQNCPRSLQERLNALHHQGNMMLLVIREHVSVHAPAYEADLEHAILCYNMVKVHLDDYFATVGSYALHSVAQRELKWWPDIMFRWVAAVVFTVLDRVDIQTLDYYVSIDNLRQVFRHLQWSNMLFNWKVASDST